MLVSFLILLCLLLASITGVLIWYINKLMKDITVNAQGLEDYQTFLTEYSQSLESVLQLDQFYGDDTITATIKNTKLVIEATKEFRDSVLVDEEEKDIE